MEPGRIALPNGVLDISVPGSRAGGPERHPESADYADQYKERIAALREAAKEEGYTLDVDSAQMFLAFLRMAPYKVRRGGVALAEYGEINAIWVSTDRQRRLSVQVFGDGGVEYVLLHAGSEPTMARMKPQRFWSENSERLSDLLHAA